MKEISKDALEDAKIDVIEMKNMKNTDVIGEILKGISTDVKKAMKKTSLEINVEMLNYSATNILPFANPILKIQLL